MTIETLIGAIRKKRRQSVRLKKMATSHHNPLVDARVTSLDADINDLTTDLNDMIVRDIAIRGRIHDPG